jgi:hypothetical protein
MNIEQPRSYFLELRNQYFGLKYLKSLMRIRDPGWKKFGSGIRDKHPGFATFRSALSSKKIGNQGHILPVSALRYHIPV